MQELDGRKKEANKKVKDLKKSINEIGKKFKNEEHQNSAAVDSNKELENRISGSRKRIEELRKEITTKDA